MTRPRITVERRQYFHDEGTSPWVVSVDYGIDGEDIPCWTRWGAQRLAYRLQHHRVASVDDSDGLGAT